MARPRKRLPLIEQIAESGRHRLFVRKPSNFDVLLEDERGEPLLRLTASNLSVGGLYLQGPMPMRIGARSFLSFSLPTAQLPICLIGQVVRIDRLADETVPQGLGIRFTEVSAKARHAIEMWLNS